MSGRVILDENGEPFEIYEDVLGRVVIQIEEHRRVVSSLALAGAAPPVRVVRERRCLTNEEWAADHAAWVAE